MSALARTLALLAIAAIAACASGSDVEVDARRPIDAPAVDGAVVDADPGDGAPVDTAIIDAPGPPPIDARVDAPPIDAPPIDGPAPVVATLLLTEVVLAPTGAEFIELVNPTAAAIDLSRYHLADAPSYFRLPAGVAGVGADSTDFVVRFPAGASIPAHSVVTVALDTAAAFTAAYPGVTPTYAITGGTMVRLTAGTGPTLTNAGEPVVLFFWDGASDRVTDVDIMIAGTPTAANRLVSKSGVAIDGPDTGATTTAYATDANTLPSQTAPGSDLSTKRVALESPAVETQLGTGNGVLGHDETSEQLGATWDTSAYTAPTPGQVPAAIGP